MPHNRFYTDSALKVGQEVSIVGHEHHHLVRVQRTQVGEQVELVNGRGQIAAATLKRCDKQSAVLYVESVLEGENKPVIILAQALLKMNHLEWIIEKGVELGTSAFWLFPGALSEKKTLSDHQCNRIDHLILSAMKQCGRLDLPTCVIKPDLLQWGPIEGTLLFGDLDATSPFLWTLAPPLKSPITLFVGPEKGFSREEIAFLKDDLKAQGLRFHPNTLRAETAPLVGLSLLTQLV